MLPAKRQLCDLDLVERLGALDARHLRFVGVVVALGQHTRVVAATQKQAAHLVREATRH